MGRRLWLLAGVVALIVTSGAALGQNLLLNPSFELDAKEDGVSPAWAKYRSGDGADGWLKPWSGPVNEWVAVCGQWLPGQWVLWGQSVPCVPGQTVTFRIWSGGFPGFNGSTLAKLEFYSPNQEGGSMALAAPASAPITGAHNWALQEVSATVPAQAVRVRAMGWIDGIPTGDAKGSAKFDDAELETTGIPPRVGPGAVKTLPDNTLVWLKWPVVVKDNGSDTSHTDCYVTGYQREGTCRVLSSSPILSNGTPVAVTKGSMLHVVGVVATVAGEKVLQASDVVPTNWDGPWPKPITINTKSLLLSPYTPGLILKLVGNVSSVAPDKTFFYLDDGAQIPGDLGNLGIKVYHTAPAPDYPAVGDTVSATGIVWTETGVDTNTYRTLSTRTSSDFAVLRIGSTPIGRNMLLNPGFEFGKDPWDGTTVPGVEPWAASTGTAGYAFYPWEVYTEAYVRQSVGGLVPGTNYEFSAWLKEEINHEGLGTLSLRIEWFNSADAPILPNTELVVDPPIDWGLFSLPATAPAGASYAKFGVWETNHVQGSGSLLAVAIDDVVVKATGP